MIGWILKALSLNKWFIGAIVVLLTTSVGSAYMLKQSVEQNAQYKHEIVQWKAAMDHWESAYHVQEDRLIKRDQERSKLYTELSGLKDKLNGIKDETNCIDTAVPNSLRLLLNGSPKTR